MGWKRGLLKRKRSDDTYNAYIANKSRMCEPGRKPAGRGTALRWCFDVAFFLSDIPGRAQTKDFHSAIEFENGKIRVGRAFHVSRSIQAEESRLWGPSSAVGIPMQWLGYAMPCQPGSPSFFVYLLWPALVFVLVFPSADRHSNRLKDRKECFSRWAWVLFSA